MSNHPHKGTDLLAVQLEWLWVQGHIKEFEQIVRDNVLGEQAREILLRITRGELKRPSGGKRLTLDEQTKAEQAALELRIRLHLETIDYLNGAGIIADEFDIPQDRLEKAYRNLSPIMKEMFPVAAGRKRKK